MPNPRVVRPELCDLVRRSAVYSFLVRCCLGLCAETEKDIEKHWGNSREEISDAGIVSSPTRIFNFFAAAACAEKYGDLGDIPGFYRCGDDWWLDVDERLATRGLVLSVRHSQYPGLIIGLRVYRHARDDRPFMLRVRGQRSVT
jgi:hypothetical protein